MEYCSCYSLASYIQNGYRLSEEELREVVSCILLGLKWLHNEFNSHGVRSLWVLSHYRVSVRTAFISLGMMW